MSTVFSVPSGEERKRESGRWVRIQKLFWPPPFQKTLEKLLKTYETNPLHRLPVAGSSTVIPGQERLGEIGNEIATTGIFTSRNHGFDAAGLPNSDTRAWCRNGVLERVMRQSNQSEAAQYNESTGIKSSARKPRGGPRISRTITAPRRPIGDLSNVATSILRADAAICGCVLSLGTVAPIRSGIGSGGAPVSCTAKMTSPKGGRVCFGCAGGNATEGGI